MSTIVVGYDETPGSQRALERAAVLAKALGAKLVVTSVAPVMVSIARSAGAIDPTDTPEMHAKELDAARAHLEGQGIQADYRRGGGQPGGPVGPAAGGGAPGLVRARHPGAGPDPPSTR